MDTDRRKSARRWWAKFLVANVAGIAVWTLVDFFYTTGGGRGDYPPIAGETLDRPAPSSWITRFREGVCFTALDENGYNNAYYRDFQRDLSDVDVLVLGSSHVEAFQVSPRSNFVYLLNERFAEGDAKLSFYNSGRSAHVFVIRGARYEEALKLFKPKKIAVFEMFHFPSKESVDYALAGKIQNKRDAAVPSFMRWAPSRRVALFWRKLTKRGEESEPNPFEGVGKNTAAPSEAPSEELKECWGDWLRRIRELSDRHGVKAIVYFHKNATLGKDGSYIPPYCEEEMAAFRELCEREGIVFVDATERFREAYEKNNVWAYGFSNAGVVSGHMNRDGHRMLADVLEETIRKMETESKENERNQ